MKLIAIKGNIVSALETKSGYHAVFQSGPDLEEWQRQTGSQGSPFFMSRDLDRLKAMIERFITGQQEDEG